MAIKDQFRLPFVLEIRPASEYSYDGAKGKLANLRLDEVDGTQTTLVNPGDVVPAEDFDGNEDAGSRQGRFLRLAGRIDLDSRLTVSPCLLRFPWLCLTRSRLGVLERFSVSYSVDGQLLIFLGIQLYI